MAKLPGFAAGAYTSLSVNADAQSCVNLYPEAVESGAGKASPVLYLTPGLRVHTTIATGAIRGLLAADYRCFAVAGDSLYEVFESGATEFRGGVNNDFRLVQMALNGNQHAIASNQRFWLDNGDHAQPISFLEGAGPVTARQIGYLDSFFIAVDSINPDIPTTSRSFHHSSSLNGLEWNVLDQAAKEGSPDQLMALRVSHHDLWLFGTESTEVWRNNYSAAPEAFPWERDPGAMIGMGIVGEFSHVKLGEGVAWLSGNPRGYCIAVHAQGYQPKRVSTHAVENEWAGYNRVDDAESFSYTDNGHEFWVINFHNANRTWVYDATTGAWHRRGWWNGTSLDRHRARCHCAVTWPSGNSMHLVGDWANGKIYEMSTSFYDDFGGPIHWERACPHVADEDKRVFHARMELDLERGTGSNWPVSLEWSNDAGHTWQPAITAATGPSDAHRTRVVWRRLGSTRDRVYRFSGTTTNKVALIDAWLRAQAGAH